MRTQTLPLRLFLVMLVVSCASAANGQITALHIVSQRPPADVLPGYVANDLLIDFNGQFTGSKMIVELTRGEIYQNTTFGGNTPPNPALFPVDPTVEWDTFVANGGPTAVDTIGDFGLGGAALGLGTGSALRNAKFDNEGIDQAWVAAAGNVILDQEDFMVARVTLSDDAVGEVLYIASANQMLGVPMAITEGLATSVFEGEVDRPGSSVRFIRVPIFNGVIGAIPEPSTCAILAISLIGLIALSRRPNKSAYRCHGR